MTPRCVGRAVSALRYLPMLAGASHVLRVRSLLICVQLLPTVDSARDVFRLQHLVENGDGRQELDADQQDLTRKTWEAPASIGKYRSAETARPTQRGVIYTVAPSPLEINRIWIGTDDGLIQMTADAGANLARRHPARSQNRS